MGSRPTAPTPNLGDQDFLSRLSPLAFGVPTPLLQGNKICNPRQGPFRVLSAGASRTLFFFEVVTPLPPPFSTGLGTGYGGVSDEKFPIMIIIDNIIFKYKYIVKGELLRISRQIVMEI
jgi:hypothetical protein